MGDEQRQCPQCFTYNNSHTFYCSKCGSALEEDQKTISYGDIEKAALIDALVFKPGEFFDNRFRIIEEVGRGGMGRVYKAEDTALKITVALKLILPELSSDPSFIERFKRETLTARSISHENVIRIYDLGEVNKTKYISMEYIKGQTLRDLIHISGFLTVDATISLIKQVCGGLQAAHKKGIIHQDLKPSNIMVDNNGQAYIMDFGLAASVSLDKKKPGEVAGTPQYMAPEQAAGAKVDQRSDIYSLGIIIYQMLTGVRPIEAETAAECLRKQVEEAPLPPSKIKRHIPHDLESIVLRCLEKQPVNRYQSVDEIIFDLDKRSSAEVPAWTRWIAGHWPGVLIGLLLLTLGGIYLWKEQSSHFPTGTRMISLAVMHMANLTGNAAFDDMGRGLSELLIADLLQSKHVRVLTGDRLYGTLKKLNLSETSRYSTEDLKQVAALGKADYILQGNLSRAGPVFRIDTSLHKADTMEVVGAQRAQAQGEDGIYAMVDSLTRKIKEDFHLSAQEIAADIDKDITTIITGSSEALKEYMKGVLLYREREFEESNQALQRAVSLDPEFALAYLKISENYSYLADEEKSAEYIAKALSLSNRVSDREFYLIQAQAARSIQESIEYYRKLLDLYPDDLSGNGYLGSAYRNLEEWDLAQERFEKIIQLDPEDELAYENLAYISMAKGLYDKARRILESQQSLFPNPVHFHFRMGMAYLCEGHPDSALKEAEKARLLEPDSSSIEELTGHIYQAKGDFGAAEKCYRKIMESNDLISQYLGETWLCHMYLLRGDTDRLESEVERGLERFQKNNLKLGLFNLWLLTVYIRHKDNRFPEALEVSAKALETALELSIDEYINFALHLRGLVYAKAGRFDEAVDTAEKMKRRIEERGGRKNMRHYHHLMGEISRAKGDIATAIDYFEMASSLLSEQLHQRDCHAFFLYSLASAYHEHNDLAKARKIYEKITALSTGRLRWGDRFALSFYHLAEIHQQDGDRQKAMNYYRKFLDLWSETDPEAPEKANASRQLASLAAADRSP